MKLAVFDVCDTLYSVNTTFDFLDTYFMDDKKYSIFRKISKLFPIKVLNYLVYKFTKKDLIRLIATSYLKNKSTEEISILSNDFIQNKLNTKINLEISNMLKSYKEQGYKIVLISGAYDFIIKEVRDFFLADEYFATQLETISDKYTGNFKKDNLLKKDVLFKEKFKDYESLVIVSDNKTDLELLLLADHSYAVCNKPKDLSFWENHKKINIIRTF